LLKSQKIWNLAAFRALIPTSHVADAAPLPSQSFIDVPPIHLMKPDRRGAYAHFQPITTRWMDNDVYGHVNNVVYYSYFDTVVNTYLIREGVLDIEAGRRSGW
jgi:hypothetical protein